jgi:hypothetical protein
MICWLGFAHCAAGGMPFSPWRALHTVRGIPIQWQAFRSGLPDFRQFKRISIAALRRDDQNYSRCPPDTVQWKTRNGA